MHSFLRILAVVCCLTMLSTAAGAESVAEPAAQTREMAGICITKLPENGTVMLGSRVLRPGDVLTADQAAQMTFSPAAGSSQSQPVLCYLPIYPDSVAEEAAMNLSLRSREDKAPIAEDAAWETYKNLEITGKLKVSEPEQQPMTFTLTRPPKRGTVTIGEDGSFLYAPKKNKIGIDSFTFTAADPAGNISREATVTITILKPTDSRQYSDTAGLDCRFQAEWMRSTGIFTGETVGSAFCFSPEKPVTQGEFVTMLMKTLDIPTDEAVTYSGYEDAPQWLQPYLAAAVRSGFTANLPVRDSFRAEDPADAETAAAWLCAALELMPREEPVLSAEHNTDLSPLTAAQNSGFLLDADTVLTRADVSEILYHAWNLKNADSRAAQ